MENGNAHHPRYRAAKRLLEGSERLAGIFRRQNTIFLQQGGMLPPLLDGVVERFLRKLAEELIAVRPDPAAPWAKAGGILRISTVRGEEHLQREVAFLRTMLEDVVEPLEGGEADSETLDFVHAALDVLYEGALDEKARLAGDPRRYAAPRFAGVVLALFEDERRLPARMPPRSRPHEPVRG